MLNEQDTLYYLRLAKQGDNGAKETLLEHNTSLLKSILKRYLNKGVEYDDLYQLSCIGFLKAIAGFDESFGVRFSTYAVPMIAGEIKRFLRDDGSVKVSRALKQSAREMNRFIEQYSSEHGEQPSVKEIAAAFSMDEGEVVFTLGSSKMPISIYEQSDYKDEKSSSLCDKLPARDDQDEMIERMLLKTAIEKLPERERKIVFLRYFRDMTQSEVARRIGVSQVQISRIENKIMQDFKRELS
ncbi:MAG: SigB/SigF/SigG family RNA polymerase sigma factor [Clostridia bacterium]|jgi:RNA polymerase sporulation-specific sigma factor|nr:SigB/SigF/SigG family RNA polymerase sigma factor [Clostridia bacterium]